jgi:hypothetical protein
MGSERINDGISPKFMNCIGSNSKVLPIIAVSIAKSVVMFEAIILIYN